MKNVILSLAAALALSGCKSNVVEGLFTVEADRLVITDSKNRTRVLENGNYAAKVKVAPLKNANLGVTLMTPTQAGRVVIKFEVPEMYVVEDGESRLSTWAEYGDYKIKVEQREEILATERVSYREYGPRRATGHWNDSYVYYCDVITYNKLTVKTSTAATVFDSSKRQVARFTGSRVDTEYEYLDTKSCSVIN